MPDIIQHNVSGFLVDPHNPQEIASVILNNYDRSSFLRKMSHVARYSVQKWIDPISSCEKIEDCYVTEVKPKTWIYHDEHYKVSVIIPLYNQGKYIHEAIESVRKSSYKNVEIIVINDGSTDGYTNKVFEELEWVIKIARPNGGLASARNAGIAASSGQFIMPLDADDRIHGLYIEKAVDVLMNNPEMSYVTCYARNFDAFETLYAPVGCVPELMLFMNTDGRCTNLYRVDAIRRVGGYDEEILFYEDWDLLITLNKRGMVGDVLPSELFYYRRHQDSMVYTKVNPKRSEIIQYIMHKHDDVLARYFKSVALNLVHLWKTKHEVNESAQHAP
jgi:glycosyltransferase involved in cell wall biosynthesis